MMNIVCRCAVVPSVTWQMMDIYIKVQVCLIIESALSAFDFEGVGVCDH